MNYEQEFLLKHLLMYLRVRYGDDNPSAGTRLWKIRYDDDDTPQLYSSNFVQRTDNGWWKLRNIRTGREWSERGTAWATSIEKALHLWISEIISCAWIDGMERSCSPDIGKFSQQIVDVVRAIDKKKKERVDD